MSIKIFNGLNRKEISDTGDIEKNFEMLHDMIKKAKSIRENVFFDILLEKGSDSKAIITISNGPIPNGPISNGGRFGKLRNPRENIQTLADEILRMCFPEDSSKKNFSESSFSEREPESPSSSEQKKSIIEVATEEALSRSSHSRSSSSSSFSTFGPESDFDEDSFEELPIQELQRKNEEFFQTIKSQLDVIKNQSQIIKTLTDRPTPSEGESSKSDLESRLQSRLRAKDKQIQALQDRLSGLENTLRMAGERFNGLMKELKRKEEEINALRDELRKTNEEKLALERNLEGLKRQLQQTRKKATENRSTLESQIRDIATREKATHDMALQKDEALRSLEKEFQKAEAEKDALRGRLEGLQRAYSEQSDAVATASSLREENGKLNEEVADLKKQFEDLQEKLEKTEEREEALQKAIQEQTERFEEQEEVLKVVASKNLKHLHKDREIEEMKDQIIELESENEDLKNELQFQKEKLIKGLNEIETLTASPETET